MLVEKFLERLHGMSSSLYEARQRRGVQLLAFERGEVDDRTAAIKALMSS